MLNTVIPAEKGNIGVWSSRESSAERLATGCPQVLNQVRPRSGDWAYIRS